MARRSIVDGERRISFILQIHVILKPPYGGEVRLSRAFPQATLYCMIDCKFLFFLVSWFPFFVLDVVSNKSNLCIPPSITFCIYNSPYSRVAVKLRRVGRTIVRTTKKYPQQGVLSLFSNFFLFKVPFRYTHCEPQLVRMNRSLGSTRPPHWRTRASWLIAKSEKK